MKLSDLVAELEQKAYDRELQCINQLNKIADLQSESKRKDEQIAKLRSLLKDIHGDITMLDEGVPVQADTWDRLEQAIASGGADKEW